MALFRDEKESLRRLEEALQEEQSGEALAEDEADDACDDGYIAGYDANVSRIRIRNTDRTDVKPEKLSRQVRKRRLGFWGTILLLLGIAALFCVLSWLVKRYMG